MQSASFSSVCRLWKSEGPWPPATGSLKLLTGKLHTQCTHAQVLGNSRSSLLTALTRPASTLLLTLQSYHPQVSDPQHGQPLNMTCGKKRISQNNFKKQIGRLLFKSQAPIIRILKDAIFFLKVSLLFSIQKIMTH